MKVVYTKSFNISDSDFGDVIVSIIEGGIGYWCSRFTIVDRDENSDTEYYEEINNGKKFKLFMDEPFETDENGKAKKYYYLTKDNLTKGIRMYIEGDYQYSNSLIDNKGNFDAGMVDAEVADCVCQLALFDDVIFN